MIFPETEDSIPLKLLVVLVSVTNAPSPTTFSQEVKIAIATITNKKFNFFIRSVL
jgi:hypothetical protein